MGAETSIRKLVTASQLLRTIRDPDERLRAGAAILGDTLALIQDIQRVHRRVVRACGLNGASAEVKGPDG